MNEKINPQLLHTTNGGAIRVKRNLGLAPDTDVVKWCQNVLRDNTNFTISRRGKNFYVHDENYIITINAHSNTIITAHKIN